MLDTYQDLEKQKLVNIIKEFEESVLMGWSSLELKLNQVLDVVSSIATVLFYLEVCKPNTDFWPIYFLLIVMHKYINILVPITVPLQN